MGTKTWEVKKASPVATGDSGVATVDLESETKELQGERGHDRVKLEEALNEENQD